MWYQVMPESEYRGKQIGLIIFSLEEVVTGLLANLVTFPMVMFIVFLFKYSKVRVLRENQVVKMLLDEDASSSEDEDENDEGRAPSRSSSQISSVSIRSSSSSSLSSERPDKFVLPFYCAYLAWILCFLCIGLSIFFLWAYGIMFGNDKTRKWLSTFLFSFFINFFIFEPIKVLSQFYDF